MLGGVAVLVLVNTCLVASHTHNEEYENDQSNLEFEVLNIIGGQNTSIEKHPYQVSITMSHGSFISGAILNKNWILACADVLSDHIDEALFVRVGSNHTEDGGTLHKVKKIVIHPKYDAYNGYYNFALVKLCKPLKFGKSVKRVKLPKKPLKAGHQVVVSGWGEISTLQGNQFKEITLKAVSAESCRQAYKSVLAYNTSESQACAIPDNYKKGPFYDYGAPLVSKNILYGEYSFRAIAQGLPAIFSNSYNVCRWIKKTIKK